MGFTDHLSEDELEQVYAASTKSAPSRDLKSRLGLRCNQLAFLRELRARGISLKGADDVLLDYPDNPVWSPTEWVTHIEGLGFLCKCGCGGPVRISPRDRFRGIAKYRKNHRGRGVPLTEKRKKNISTSLQGKKRSEGFKNQRREYMQKQWEDPEYQRKQKLRMTEVNADPARREARREIMLTWLKENPGHIAKLARASKAWAKANPQKKIEAAKRGHKALAGRGKRSSIERALEKALSERGIPFVPEWEYKLGVADFKIGHVIVFADGDYWHGPGFPKQQAKDRKQTTYLETVGFTVLRFTGTEIRTNVSYCVDAIQQAVNTG